MQQTVTLLGCRLVYEHHFQTQLRGDLPFNDAFHAVAAERGHANTLDLVQTLLDEHKESWLATGTYRGRPE